MLRLTKKETSGRWKIEGVAWEDLQNGSTITKEVRERLYGCIKKLKDYEDTGISPDQLSDWKYELEDLMGHVCDNLCYHRKEAKKQEELDEFCAHCKMSACMDRLLKTKEE